MAVRRSARRDGLADLTEAQRAAVEAFEAGEDIGMGEVVEGLRVQQPLGKIVPIRMSEDQWQALRREAGELGVRPTTLMRMWILERLREAARSRRPAAS